MSDTNKSNRNRRRRIAYFADHADSTLSALVKVFSFKLIEKDLVAIVKRYSAFFVSEIQPLPLDNSLFLVKAFLINRNIKNDNCA